MKNNVTSDNKGFSLVELIIVIAVMAVLMGVIAPTLISYIEKSRESTDLQNIGAVRRAILTAMSEEAVYHEVMDDFSGSKLIIDLGRTNQASFDSAGLAQYSKLQKKLKEAMTTDIDIKSTAALVDDNHLLVEIKVDGTVSVYIGTSATSDSSSAVQCSKTTDVDGEKRLFLISE